LMRNSGSLYFCVIPAPEVFRRCAMANPLHEERAKGTPNAIDHSRRAGSASSAVEALPRFVTSAHGSESQQLASQ
jgi:hypothetical protein